MARAVRDALPLIEAVGSAEVLVIDPPRQEIGTDIARLLAAHALLGRRPTGTIADVAFACGFDSLSSFYRNFRARFGHAPGDLLGSHAPQAR